MGLVEDNRQTMNRERSKFAWTIKVDLKVGFGCVPTTLKQLADLKASRTRPKIKPHNTINYRDWTYLVYQSQQENILRVSRWLTRRQVTRYRGAICKVDIPNESVLYMSERQEENEQRQYRI